MKQKVYLLKLRYNILHKVLKKSVYKLHFIFALYDRILQNFSKNL